MIQLVLQSVLRIKLIEQPGVVMQYKQHEQNCNYLLQHKF